MYSTLPPVSLSMRMRSDAARAGEVSVTKLFTKSLDLAQSPVKKKRYKSHNLVQANTFDRLSGLNDTMAIELSGSMFPDRTIVNHPTTNCVQCGNHSSMCMECCEVRCENTLISFRETRAAGAKILFDRAIVRTGQGKLSKFLIFLLWKNSIQARVRIKHRQQAVVQKWFCNHFAFIPFKAWQKYTQDNVLNRKNWKINELREQNTALDHQTKKDALDRTHFEAKIKAMALEIETKDSHLQQAHRDISDLKIKLESERRRVIGLSSLTESVQMLFALSDKACVEKSSSIRHSLLDLSTKISSHDYGREFGLPDEVRSDIMLQLTENPNFLYPKNTSQSTSATAVATPRPTESETVAAQAALAAGSVDIIVDPVTTVASIAVNDGDSNDDAAQQSKTRRSSMDRPMWTPPDPFQPQLDQNNQYLCSWLHQRSVDASGYYCEDGRGLDMFLPLLEGTIASFQDVANGLALCRAVVCLICDAHQESNTMNLVNMNAEGAYEVNINAEEISRFPLALEELEHIRMLVAKNHSSFELVEWTLNLASKRLGCPAFHASAIHRGEVAATGALLLYLFQSAVPVRRAHIQSTIGKYVSAFESSVITVEHHKTKRMQSVEALNNVQHAWCDLVGVKLLKTLSLSDEGIRIADDANSTIVDEEFEHAESMIDVLNQDLVDEDKPLVMSTENETPIITHKAGSHIAIVHKGDAAAPQDMEINPFDAFSAQEESLERVITNEEQALEEGAPVEGVMTTRPSAVPSLEDHLDMLSQDSLSMCPYADNADHLDRPRIAGEMSQLQITALLIEKYHKLAESVDTFLETYEKQPFYDSIYDLNHNQYLLGRLEDTTAKLQEHIGVGTRLSTDIRQHLLSYYTHHMLRKLNLAS